MARRARCDGRQLMCCASDFNSTGSSPAQPSRTEHPAARCDLLSSRSTECPPAKCRAAPTPSRDRRGIKSIPAAVTDGEIRTLASVTGVDACRARPPHCLATHLLGTVLPQLGGEIFCTIPATHSFLSCAAILPRAHIGCSPLQAGGPKQIWQASKASISSAVLALTNAPISQTPYISIHHNS